MLRPTTSKPRHSKHLSLEVRNANQDELSEFNKNDLIESFAVEPITESVRKRYVIGFIKS